MAMQSGFIKRIRDIMRMDAGINGDAQRIEQMVWMLFLKVYDSKEDDWEINEDQVNVRCSNVERINLIADGFVGAGITVIAENGKMINACSIPIQGTENYVRLECIDEKGRTAWTNPIFTGR